MDGKRWVNETQKSSVTIGDSCSRRVQPAHDCGEACVSQRRDHCSSYLRENYAGVTNSSLKSSLTDIEQEMCGELTLVPGVLERRRPL